MAKEGRHTQTYRFQLKRQHTHTQLANKQQQQKKLQRNYFMTYEVKHQSTVHHTHFTHASIAPPPVAQSTNILLLHALYTLYKEKHQQNIIYVIIPKNTIHFFFVSWRRQRHASKGGKCQRTFNLTAVHSEIEEGSPTSYNMTYTTQRTWNGRKAALHES